MRNTTKRAGAAQDALAASSQYSGAVYSKIVSVKPERVTITGLALGKAALTIECRTSDNLPPPISCRRLIGWIISGK